MDPVARLTDLNTGRAVFLGDISHGPSHLVAQDTTGAFVALEGRLPADLGQRTTYLPQSFYTADRIVTAALGVDLDGDGRDELVTGAMYSYSAAALDPALDQPNAVVYRQDEAGVFAASASKALPNGRFPMVGCYDNATSQAKQDCYGATVKQIASADFNQDGRPDLLITHHRYGYDTQGQFRTGSQTQLLLNKGALEFEDVTASWFGSDMVDLAGGYVHSHAADLNGDGCVDVVLRGDANNARQPRVFLSDCKGKLVEFTTDFLQLIPNDGTRTLMHGGVPVTLGGKSAIALFSPGKVLGSTALHVVRFKRNLPTPQDGRIKY